ncbi:MAG TPA: hypothetical protein VMM59_11475 [Thermohalobaculum sp.]|nr:hypothetical protein [Thermohalobaculum sp.]
MTERTPEWLRERERGNALALSWISRLARSGPGWVTDPLIWLIALYFTLLPSRSSAAASRAYLRRILGRRPGLAERHRHVRTFAHVIVDRVRLLTDGIGGFSVRPVNAGAVVRCHAAGRGGVLLGAHFGSFEALRAFGDALPGFRVRYLMFSANARQLAQVVDRLSPGTAASVIPLDDGPSAMIEAREALSGGQFIAFLGDRMPVRNPRAEVTAAFLGGPVRLPRAPYHIAMLAEVPLFLCFAPRVGARSYDIEFSEIYDGAPVAREERDAKCRELAQRYAHELERMCRRHPYNWFNFFDIWG